MNKHNWQKFRSLSRPDRRLLLRAAIALPIVAVMQRFLGVRRCQAILAWFTPLQESPESNPAANLDSARHIAHLVHIAARHGFHSVNCLNRSLVLWWLLRSHGLASEIHYGARTSDHGFEAHAWIEHANQVIGDNRDIRQSFAPFEPPMSMEQLARTKPTHSP